MRIKRDDNPSTSYFNAYKTVLAKVFDYEIMRKGSEIKINPVRTVKMPRGVPSKKRHAATPEQETIIKQSVDKPFGFYAFLLLYTGCRSQEALALQWNDIDFENDTISINKALTFPHNQPEIKEPKTENGFRTIPLLAPLKTELLKRKPEECSDDSFIFGGIRPLTQQEYTRRWRRYSLETGFRKEYFIDTETGEKLETLSELKRIPVERHKRITEINLTPHQLRHSFATMCVEADLSAEEAQQLLGHSDIRTTINVYTDIRSEKQKKIGAKLNAFVQNN